MFLHEKRDGTCITCWFDGIDWRVSTLGTITPMKIGYNDFTFADLFKSAVGKSFFNLEKENTYIFELMSPYNRIVTDYGDSIIVSPLAVRNNKSGEYVIGYREFDIINLAPVHRISCYDLNIKNKEEMISFVENFQGNTSHFGKNPEGWVVYINDIPVAKVKNSRYLALHRFSDSDPLCSRNSLVDLFLAGGVDDVYSDLSPTMKAFCDSMGEFIRNNGADFIALCSSVKEKNPQTQKDYALLVKDTPFAAFMFKNKDFIMNNVVTIEDFTSFVRKDIPKTIYEQLKGLWVGPLLTQAVE
jgi:hypothetical protein